VSRTEEPDTAVPPPSVGTLEALPSDVWAALLPAVRAGLQELEDHEVTPVVRRLRAAPTGRLAGGRVRRELCALLAGGGAPWHAVVGQLQEASKLPPALAALSRGEEPPNTPPRPPAHSATDATEQALRRAREGVDRARARLREVRDERDVARRRVEGAQRRAAAAEAELEGLRAELAASATERSALEAALAEADLERKRAVEREARRREAEVAVLRAELAELRRAEEEQRLAARRREEARQQAERDTARSAVEARREARGHRAARVRPGRPSVLPEGMATDTAEAADALLHRGRLVLVDGYNLTLQHRGDLPLERQRAWLTQLLATLAATRRVRPVVVFDGEHAGGGRPRIGSREVEVRFTPAGITADDELVLAVEATDEPVLVVTDDRELRTRVRASGADVIGTGPFLWAVS
jgi:predicted RNA-binding protein with PIN domain